MIPTQFGVEVNTPQPLQVTIDVSQRTMLLVAFAVVAAGVVMKKIKGL
jgi:hypothetical protein